MVTFPHTGSPWKSGLCSLQVKVKDNVVQDDPENNGFQVDLVIRSESSDGSLCHRGQCLLTVLYFSPMFDLEGSGVNAVTFFWNVETNYLYL